MNFRDYQRLSRETAIYPKVGKNFVYPALGLGGETGEVLEKIKKIIRDNNGKITSRAKRMLAKELGDVLWYLSQLCSELNLDFQEIAKRNIEKLKSRQRRGKLRGSGDER